MATLFAEHTSWSPSWFQCFLILLGGLLLFAFFDIRLSTRIQTHLRCGRCRRDPAAGDHRAGERRRLRRHDPAAQSLEAPVHARALPRRRVRLHGLHRLRGSRGSRGRGSRSPPRDSAGDPHRGGRSGRLVRVHHLGDVVGFGVANSGKWAQDVAPLDTLANRYSGTWLSVLVDIAVITSAFIASLAGLHLTARTFFAMGREGGLPRIFAWTHPAGAALGSGSARLSAHVPARFDSRPPLDASGSRAVHLHPVHGADRDAGRCSAPTSSSPSRGWSRSGAHAGRTSPTTSCSTSRSRSARSQCAGTRSTSRCTLPPSPMKYGPWVALIWLALGVAVVGWLTVTKPDRVTSFGSILGEGEAVSPSTPAPPPEAPLAT